MIKRLSKLQTTDKEFVKSSLENLIYSDKNTYSAKTKEYNQCTCPHCSSINFSKNGFDKFKNQKYKCATCSKNFSESNGSSIHWLHLKQKWFKYIDIFFNGEYYSVRKIAEILDINPKTAFRWRHKILYGIEMEINKFNGIVEIDDLHYNFSQKGRRNIDEPKKRGGEGKKQVIIIYL